MKFPSRFSGTVSAWSLKSLMHTWPPRVHEHSANTCPADAPLKQNFLWWAYFLLPPVTPSIPAHWYQQHYDLLRHGTVFSQCFPSHIIVITDEVLALRAFWVLAAGAGKLWSANICNQQLTSHCHLPAQADNKMLCFCAQHLTLRAKEGPPGCETSWAYTLPTAVGFV